jgi:hypothetical protein
MRTVLLLAGDRQLNAKVRHIVGDDWRIEEASDWPSAIGRLGSRDPPQALLCSGSLLGPGAPETFRELRRKSCLISAAVYLERPTPALSYLAGQLYRYRVQTIFGAEELEMGVRVLLRRATHDLGQSLLRKLGAGTTLVRRLLETLDRQHELSAERPDRLASELRCSRSALYRALRSAGLPPPGSIQALYRLWPGVVRIVAGGRGADAATEAHCPHYHSFRKAVWTHFGLSIGQLRAAPDLDSVLRRWVDFHQSGAIGHGASRRPLAPFEGPRRKRQGDPPKRI